MEEKELQEWMSKIESRLGSLSGSPEEHKFDPVKIECPDCESELEFCRDCGNLKEGKDDGEED